MLAGRGAHFLLTAWLIAYCGQPAPVVIADSIVDEGVASSPVVLSNNLDITNSYAPPMNIPYVAPYIVPVTNKFGVGLTLEYVMYYMADFGWMARDMGVDREQMHGVISNLWVEASK